MDNIYDEYLLARWFYLMGEPRLSDIEYDKLEQEFKKEYPNDIHSKQSWSYDEPPVAQLRAIGREDLIIKTTMGYMAESISSINTEADYNLRFSNLALRSRLSFKIDGWNTRASYYNGVLVKVESRGRNGSNLSMENIARLFPKKIKYRGRVAVTGETSIPNDKWPLYKAETGNTDQRASVRTAIARGDAHMLSFVAFGIFSEQEVFADPYETLTELGFTVPFYRWVSSKKELDAMVKYFSELSPYYDYLTDGLVIENSSYQLAIRLGAWEEVVMQSRVTGYEINPGMYGSFLKVLCDPVAIEGKTYSRISINNIASIIENNLRVGSPIAFNQRSAANVVIDTLATKNLQKMEGFE